MPAYNFQKRFARKVRRNEKPGTVRAFRKNQTKVGDTMYLFTGMRTSQCVRLATRKCVGVIEIGVGFLAIYINDIRLTKRDANAFARLDGFTNHYEFIEFFNPRSIVPDIYYWHVWNPKALKRFKKYMVTPSSPLKKYTITEAKA